MRKAEWFSLIMIVAFFATGAAVFPQLPPLVASHWDSAGNVNGYMSRFWGVFVLPVVMLFIALLFFAIPRIDPRKDNIAKFRKYFDHFVIAFIIFFYYIYLLMLLWNLGYRFNFVAFIIPGISALFYISGMILPKTEPNFTIGIRTPWTISSPAVWKRTHEVGGTLFKIAAIIGLVGIFLPASALWITLIPLIAAVVGVVIYSYVLYTREEKGRTI